MYALNKFLNKTSSLFKVRDASVFDWKKNLNDDNLKNKYFSKTGVIFGFYGLIYIEKNIIESKLTASTKQKRPEIVKNYRYNLINIFLFIHPLIFRISKLQPLILTKYILMCIQTIE